MENKIKRIFKKEGEVLNSGFSYKGKEFITHTDLPHEISALVTFSNRQKLVILAIAGAIATGFLISFQVTLITIVTILSIIYFLDAVFSFYLLSKSLHSPPEIVISDTELANLKEKDLPVYSILCPLYKESKILPQFIQAIDEIDWPKKKLDVMLLLEEDDQETIQTAKNLDLPEYFRVLVVPDSQPKTKPKACNYGLQMAKGEFVVIFDAEDKPEPLQLKKTFLSFKKLPSSYICVQSKLNYYNSDHNLLTRLFTAEYSLWFDLILPGLQTIETSIPLGGTSNHFKTKELKKLHGWDPFNVTEDCDLGVRLFKKGYKTAIVDSTTYEEANSRIKNWIRQRSRWIKGYLQTYLVHMRNPIEFYRSSGWHALIFQLVIGLRISFILINPVLWAMTASYFIFYDQVGLFIESLYPTPVFYIAILTSVFGNLMYFFNYMIGVAKREQWELVKYIFFVPFYWMLTSMAAVVSLYQLIVKPHYWEKTHHGLHLENRKKKLDLGFITDIPANAYALLSRPLHIKKQNDVQEAGKPLNILVLNWRDTRHKWAGGAEVYVHEMAKQWKSMGHNVTLFCGNDGKLKRNEIIDGVNVIRRGGFYTVYLWAFLYYIFKLRGKTDFIVESGNGAPFFTTIYSRKPKVLILHHIHQEVFRAMLPGIVSAVARFVEAQLMPFFYRNSTIVTVSESTKKDIIKLGLSLPEKIYVIPPGVNIPEKNGFRKTKYPSLIYLGRLKDYKNVDIAIKAAAKLLPKYPDLRLKIVGNGETYLELKKLTKELGVEDKVELTGRVSEHDKFKHFTQSWIALQPSSFEGWGITVLEANSCATPVISSNVKGLRDSVVDGKTGLLVRKRSIDDWTKSIDLVIEDEEFRKEMSVSAKAWAESFKWSESAKVFMEIIKKEINQNEQVLVESNLINRAYARLELKRENGRLNYQNEDE